MAVSPAGTITTGASIVHDAAAYYDRVALDNVKKVLRFFTLTESRRLPKASGVVHQMFRYIPFAANTTAGSEGTIGTSIAPTTETVSATVLQYFDNFFKEVEEKVSLNILGRLNCDIIAAW